MRRDGSFGNVQRVTIEVDMDMLPAPARKVLGSGAPAPMRMMAAKGVLPGAKPADVVTVVAVLSTDGDEKVASAARGTLTNLPAPILNGALTADLPEAIIAVLADCYASDHGVVEKLLRMPRVGRSALEALADNADERLGELIAVNEERLLEMPSVIEKLYLNKKVRMSTADRLLELCVRNDVTLNIPAFQQAAAAIQNELIPEPTEEPTFDDKLFEEVRVIGEEVSPDTESEVEDTHEVDEETGEEAPKAKFKPLYVKVGEMSVTAKIRTAMLGSSAERMLLIRDKNKLVASAAATSPKMKENEAVQITASRAVGEDVLRIIARNREFTRSYQVKLNLVRNPRTPFTFASAMVSHLREVDLRQLSRSKNVPGQIARAARQQLQRKKK